MVRTTLLLTLLLVGCPQPGDDDDSSPADDDDTTAGTDDDDTLDDFAECGNGVLEEGEDCDEGDANGSTVCGCQIHCGYAGWGTACEDGDPCSVHDHCDEDGGCMAGEPLDCDDGDGCTTDSCEPGTGECLNEPQQLGDPLDLWDVVLLTDPSTLDVDVIDTETVWEGLTAVEVQEIRFTSYQSDDCERSGIRLEAYVAYPPGATSLDPAPGVALAHGLGGWAEASTASGPAAAWGVVTIAWSGPGQGQSEGWGSEADHLFDTVDDPRDSWFWEHAAAGIRALTVLETLAEVDPSRLGMVGYSGGGLATLIANGVDSRITTAAPVSATGHLDLAIAATPVPGWEWDLLQSMDPPREPTDLEWLNFVDYLDPMNYLASAHGQVLLIDGAQDEFFPVDSLQATYADLDAAGNDPRLLVIENWDHGWFALFTADEATERTDEALAWWLGHGLGTDADFAEFAPRPQVDMVVPWVCWWELLPYDCSAAQVSLSAATGYDVTGVTFHHSSDGSLTYFSTDLTENGGVWQGEVPTLDGTAHDASDTVWLAEVEFRADLFGLKTFTLTSEINIPPGFSPNILPIDGPIP